MERFFFLGRSFNIVIKKLHLIPRELFGASKPLNKMFFITTKAFPFKGFPLPSLPKTRMDSPRKILHTHTAFNSASRSPPKLSSLDDAADRTITLQEWQGWGTTSPLPAMVTEIIEELKSLEKNVDTQMTFGGKGGKLQVSVSVRSFPYPFCDLIWEFVLFSSI